MRSKLLALAVALPLCAADVSGKWKGAMETGRDVVFELKSEGSKVSGTMSGPQGEPRRITEGKLEGDNIALKVASEWEGNPVTLLVKGKVAGNEMRLTVEAEGGGWSTTALVKKAAE